jgi:hypothetical protein
MLKRREHIMNKWALLLFMSLTFLTMIGLPGLVDSERRAIAIRNYRSTPSEATLKELKDAKRADIKSVLRFEIVLAILLGTSIFVYVRLEKQFS